MVRSPTRDPEMLRGSIVCLTLSCFTFGSPGRATSAEPEPEGWIDERQDPRFREELLGYSMQMAIHGQDETYVSPVFRAAFSPIALLSLDLQFGFVATPELRAGNPTLTVWFCDRLGPANPERRSFDDVGGGVGQRSSIRTRFGTSYRIGLAVAAPLASADSLRGGAALAGAALQRGNRNGWLWASESFAAALPAELTSRTENFQFGLDAAFAFFAPVGTAGRDVEVAWQAGVEFTGVFLRDQISFGTRFDVVHYPSHPIDGLQTSAEPFFKLALFDHYLRLGLRLNLDELGGPPFVPTFAGVPSWSINVTVGGAVFH